MKIGFYPGSFNPWHEGHQDVLNKALKVFDRIVILQMSNSEKGEPKLLTYDDVNKGGEAFKLIADREVHIIPRSDMSIVSAVGGYILGGPDNTSYAIIRGLRNEKDFCEEQILQYCYEDMGIKIPIFFIIADKSLVHVSSSALKAMNKYTE